MEVDGQGLGCWEEQNNQEQIFGKKAPFVGSAETWPPSVLHFLDAVSFWRREKYNHSPLAGLCESKHCRLSYWLLSIVYRKCLTPRHIDLWTIGKALFLVNLVSCSAPGTRMNHQVAEDTNLPRSGMHRCSASSQSIIHLFLLIILNTINPPICP